MPAITWLLSSAAAGIRQSGKSASPNSWPWGGCSCLPSAACNRSAGPPCFRMPPSRCTVDCLSFALSRLWMNRHQRPFGCKPSLHTFACWTVYMQARRKTASPQPKWKGLLVAWPSIFLDHSTIASCSVIRPCTIHTLGRKLGLGVGPGWTGAAATHQSLGAAIITALPFSPALADQMPLVYHPEWLFDKVMDAMLVLFSQRRVHLAITMLDFLLPRLAPMSIGLSTFGEEVQGVSDNEPAHETGHQQLVKAMLSAILTASSQQQSTVAFCAFKALLQIYTDDVKSRILLGILVDSKAPAMIVAGISLLKDAIHLALQDNGGREAKTASLFGTHVARDTFLSILLDGRSALYRNEVVFKGSSIFDSEPLLFERHSVLMHSLNLYQYLLLRQTPDTDRLGVWDSMHINATSQKLLAPLEKAVSRAITGLEDKQKPNAAPGDENADDLLRQLMDMRVLENVLHHVQGITRRLS
ncbi:hypothetical protein BC831DRAFT_289179 [Entophlyctis helioformis]|nr:hypothetical protein BC831DRAFT_289179 [Entophlyctis helioformis]